MTNGPVDSFYKGSDTEAERFDEKIEFWNRH